MYRWLKKHGVLIALALIAFLPFAFTLFDPFVSDDWDFLYSAHHQGFSLSQIFSTNNEGNLLGGSYRPMVVVFWRGLYQLFHLHPFPYHATTIALHVFNALLLFFLVKRLCIYLSYSPRIAFFASILFAISPSRGEIAWISVVNDTLVTFCILLACNSFISFLHASKKTRRFLFLVFSLLITFFAFLTKEVALVIPPTIFVLAYFFGNHQSKKVYIRFFSSAGYAALYACIVVIFFALRYRVIGLLFSDYTGDIVLTPYHVIRALVSYTFGFFLSGEIRTSVSYFFIHHFLLFVILFLSFITLSVYSLRTIRTPLLSLVILGLYFVSLIPIIRFGINVTPGYISDEGQRYLYVPSIFLCFFISILLSSWYERLKNTTRVYFFAAGVLVGGVLYGQLFIQTSHFHSASHIAQTLLIQAKNITENGGFDGFIVVGLPDQYAGAPIFRNTFERALSLISTDPELAFTRLIVSRNRTLYDPRNNDFTITRVDEKTFTYAQSNHLPYISSAKNFVSYDYQSSLLGYQKQSYALSVFDVGSGLSLSLSDEFLATRKKIDDHIALLFFSGGGWKVYPL